MEKHKINRINLILKNSLAFLRYHAKSTPGQDKLLKLLCYTSKLLTRCTSSKDTKTKLITFGNQMSECRVILHMLNNIPVLYDLISYAWPIKESQKFIGWYELIQCILQILYAPLEHVVWAAQHKFVSIDIEKWDYISNILWIITLQLDLVKYLRTIYDYEICKQKLIGVKDVQSMVFELCKKQFLTLLLCTQCIMDMISAINCLPPNILWGGRLKTWQIGVFGTISSCIGLYLL